MNSCNSPSGCELVTLANTLSCALAKNLSTDDVNLLAGFFSAVGDNLAILASVRSKCEDNAK